MMESPPQLRKVLGRREVLGLSFGAMIGWSWVVLSGEMIERAGSLGSVLAFVAGGIMVALVGLTYAELTPALSRAGGELTFTFVGLGSGASFLCGWTLVLAYFSVCAFEAVALPLVVGFLFPELQFGYLYTVQGWDVYWSWVAVGALGALLIAAVNFLGIRLASFVQWSGSLATVAGYLLVAASFLAIHRKYPGLPRPYRTPRPRLVGMLALTVTAFFTLLYLPGSPSALLWPQEWAIVLGWVLLGGLLLLMRGRRLSDAARMTQRQYILGEYDSVLRRVRRGGGPPG